MRMLAYRRIVALLLFGSGFSALVYQTAWQRAFRLVFGASTAAAAAVLAVFLGGLGIGGLYFGRRIERSERPLAVYGALELGVALSAAASPFLIDVLARPYWAIGGSFRLGTAGATFVRLLIATLGMGPSVFLMGGTLPAAARAVEAEGDRSRRELALLYGANTLGAVLGSVLGTFFLFELLGVRICLWAAALVNLLVAVTARALSRTRDPVAVAAPTLSDAPGRQRLRVTHAAAFVAGFSFLLLEIVWYRLLAPLLGGSTYTFGLVLAVALLGIGLGGWAYAMRPEDRPSTLSDLAVVFTLEGVFVALPIALGDRIAVYAAAARAVSSMGFAALVASWTSVAMLVVFPAAIVSGYAFPLLFSLAGEGRAGVARDVGSIYAWNTAGSILGSLVGGFFLIVRVGAVGSYRFVAASLLASGALLGALAWVRAGRRAALAACAVALLAAIGASFTAAEGPTSAWRHQAVGAGRVQVAGFDRNDLREWAARANRSIIWQRDGIETAVGLKRTDELSFLVDGKSDGSAISDRGTQVMFALLGALIHPRPKRALVIGLGTGMSAGWLAKVPGLDTVDVVEFEPSITSVAKAFEGANQHVLDARNVALHFGDGREWVLATNRKYELIVSEPSNPYRSGIAALYTHEYYKAAAARLNPGGIYAQWVQGYEIDVDALRTVARTLYGAFPNVSLWHTESSDLLFLASQEPMTIDVDHVRELITQEPFRSALTRAWLVSDVEGVLSHFILENRFVSKLAHAIGIEENTDDQNLLEYAFARKVGTQSADLSEKLLRVADALRQNRPALSGASAGAVNWNRVAEERPRAWLISMHSTYGLPMPTPSAELRAAAVSLGCHGQTGEAYDKWLAQDDQTPRDDIERLVVAMGLARRNDARARSLADELERNGLSSEADLVRALFAMAEKDPEAAMGHEEQALTHLRNEAFPLCTTAQQVSELARSIVQARASLAGRALGALLAGPFVAQTYDDSRTANARLIAEMVFDPTSCIASLGPLRTTPIWDEKFLNFRLKCLSAAKDPLAAQAERDVVAFRSGTAGDFNEILMQ